MNHLMSDRTLRLVTEANPVPTSRLNAEESARAEQLLQNLTAASRTALPEAPRRWGTRSRAVVGGVVALLAAVGGGFLVTAPASAEQVLLEAASNSDHQMAEGAMCTSTDMETGVSETYLCERDAWLEVQGHVTLEKLPSDRDVVTLEKLPTDPEALSEALTEQGKVTLTPIGKPHRLWTAATGLLSNSAAGPELRGALWETIATVPGLTLDGETTDAIGREGTAVSVDFGSQDLGGSVVVLDPSDGRLLELRQLDDDGAVLRTETVVERADGGSAPKP
ncbi:hypothetical protein [Promicromonospora sp. NPDC023805]|uniref:hypothetical protein n=1 Tax=Promicromonospora sp. NPDC023805 TaxID=3154696 RepID=UPI0033D46D28